MISENVKIKKPRLSIAPSSRVENSQGKDYSSNRLSIRQDHLTGDNTSPLSSPPFFEHVLPSPLTKQAQPSIGNEEKLTLDAKFLNDLIFLIENKSSPDLDNKYFLSRDLLHILSPDPSFIKEFLNSMSRFWHFNQNILKDPEPPMAPLTNVLFSCRRSFSGDDFLSKNLPDFIYFFDKFKNTEAQNNLINTFSRSIVKHLKVDIVSSCNMKFIYFSPAVSCCLLLYINDIENCKRSVHSLFYNFYRARIVQKDLLFKDLSFFYISFCFFSKLSEILEDSLNAEESVIASINQWMVLIAQEWEVFFENLPEIKKELGNMKNLSQSQYVNAKALCKHVHLYVLNIKNHSYVAFMKLYRVTKITKEINFMKFSIFNTPYFKEVYDSLSGLNSQINLFYPNGYENILSNSSDELLIHMYHEILSKFHSSCLNFNCNEAPNSYWLEVILKSPLLFLESAKSSNLAIQNEEFKMILMNRYKTIYTSFMHILKSIHEHTKISRKISNQIITFYIGSCITNSNHHFCNLSNIEHSLDSTLDSFESTYGNQSIHPVVFYLSDAEKTYCFVVDIAQKIAMVDSLINKRSSLFQTLSSRYEMITFPQSFHIDTNENAFKRPLIAFKLALSLLKSEYIYLMKEILLMQTQGKKNDFVEFYIKDLTGKVRKYQNLLSKPYLEELNKFHTHNGNFRTLAEYGELINKKDSLSTRDSLRGEKLYAFKLTLKLVNIIFLHEMGSKIQNVQQET